MLKYPLTADVPEVVYIELIITTQWLVPNNELGEDASRTTLFDRKWAGVLSRNSFPHI